ncbi:MAG: radical SAM protein [Desulfobacterales bacterium]
MTISEIEAKSILRKHKRIDPWFISRYGMNLYRGCHHNCTYCDGRSEDYYVEGDFGRDVGVKVNAPEILRRELDPKRKRIPLKRSFVLMGGGVGDSYQPVENDYELSKQILRVIHEYHFPVHVLTKSILVKRDVDILKKINRETRAIVSFSFSSVDEKISAIFEPGVPSPAERLEAMAFFKNEGIACGMFLMPVIPFITDMPALIESAVKMAKEVGADFINFGGMTLKEGNQKQLFFESIQQHYPELMPEYLTIYRDDKWGTPSDAYSTSVHQIFNIVTQRYGMPKRVPLSLFSEVLDENDRVVIILEHMDYLLKLRGQKTPFGYAAYAISQVKEPLSSQRLKLRNLKGVGNVTERTILEILDTGSAAYYKELMGP